MVENHLQMSAADQARAETFGPLDPGQHADPLLAARGARYGAFRVNAAISQALKAQMRATPNWANLAPDMKEALEMVAHKISRILAGDPNYDDSWVDIAGYATRVADRLRPQPFPPAEAPALREEYFVQFSVGAGTFITEGEPTIDSAFKRVELIRREHGDLASGVTIMRRFISEVAA